MEGSPHGDGTDFGSEIFSHVLNVLREFNLQTAWQIKTVFRLHHVCDAALTTLTVHTNDCFVSATKMLGIKWQIRNTPGVVTFAQFFKTLLDGILVTTAECGVHQVAHVRVTRVHGQTIAILGSATQRINVGDVEFGINAIDKQVECQVNDVNVASALAIAEQCSFNTIGAGHHAKLGSSDTTAAIVMRMQTDDHAIAIFDGATEPLNDIAINVGAIALNCCGQVQDEWIFGSRLNDIHDCFTHFDCIFGFGERETLGGVFVTHDCSGQGAFH